MEVSDSLSEVGSRNVHISQATLMILRIKDTLGNAVPEKALQQQLKNTSFLMNHCMSTW